MNHLAVCRPNRPSRTEKRDISDQFHSFTSTAALNHILSATALGCSCHRSLVPLRQLETNNPLKLKNTLCIHDLSNSASHLWPWVPESRSPPLRLYSLVAGAKVHWPQCPYEPPSILSHSWHHQHYRGMMTSVDTQRWKWKRQKVEAARPSLVLVSGRGAGSAGRPGFRKHALTR